MEIHIYHIIVLFKCLPDTYGYESHYEILIITPFEAWAKLAQQLLLLGIYLQPINKQLMTT